MDIVRRDALVSALEACVAALEQHAGAEASFAPDGGSLPRLRRASGGYQSGPATPGMGMSSSPDMSAMAAQEIAEMAAEMRDIIGEVRAGNAAKGWINSVAGRASRFLEADVVDRVQCAAGQYFG